jgi:hypothetical protein
MDYYIKAAMITLDTETITFYQEAINRCKKKLELKKLFNSSKGL